MDIRAQLSIVRVLQPGICEIISLLKSLECRHLNVEKHTWNNAIVNGHFLQSNNLLPIYFWLHLKV